MAGPAWRDWQAPAEVLLSECSSECTLPHLTRVGLLDYWALGLEVVPQGIGACIGVHSLDDLASPIRDRRDAIADHVSRHEQQLPHANRVRGSAWVAHRRFRMRF